MAEEPKVEEEPASDYDALLAAIGMRIRAARLRANLRQTDVAKAVHTSQGQVGAIELGLTSLNMRSLVRIAAALGVTPVSLLTDTDAQVKSVIRQLSQTLAALQDADRARADLEKNAIELLEQGLMLLRGSVAEPESDEPSGHTKHEI